MFDRRGFLGGLTAGIAAAKSMGNRLWGQVSGGGGRFRPACLPGLICQHRRSFRRRAKPSIWCWERSIRWPVKGRTSLAGLRREGAVEFEDKKGGGVRFTKHWWAKSAGPHKEVTLDGELLPHKGLCTMGNAPGWTRSAWSTPIETHLELPVPQPRSSGRRGAIPSPTTRNSIAEPWPDVFFNSLKWFYTKEGPSGATRS